MAVLRTYDSPSIGATSEDLAARLKKLRIMSAAYRFKAYDAMKRPRLTQDLTRKTVQLVKTAARSRGMDGNWLTSSLYNAVSYVKDEAVGLVVGVKPSDVQNTIEQTQQLERQLRDSIAEREAVDQPPPPATYTALENAQEGLDDLKQAASVLNTMKETASIAVDNANKTLGDPLGFAGKYAKVLAGVAVGIVGLVLFMKLK